MLPKVFLLFMVAALVAAMAGIPPRPVDVRFSRNYVPTRAFDHIRQVNAGKQVNIVLDKSA
ncbi:hypothetical protein SUGI_0212280, partial [Cryptomeria japonica]